MSTTPAEPTGDRAAADISYADASAELDRIVAQLESDDLDIDLLATRVERAAWLIEVCRSRIEHARVDVERIVVGLEAPAPDQPRSE